MSAEDFTAREFLDRLVEVSVAFGAQADVGAAETAGCIVSCLSAHPEEFDRFMREGPELIIDGTVRPETGALSLHARDGRVIYPRQLRRAKGTDQ